MNGELVRAVVVAGLILLIALIFMMFTLFKFIPAQQKINDAIEQCESEVARDRTCGYEITTFVKDTDND